MLLMSIVYVALALLAGPGFVEKRTKQWRQRCNLCTDPSWNIHSWVCYRPSRGSNGVGRNRSSIPEGLLKKLVPDSKPALDVPIVFPYAPNAVLIGFFVSFFVGTLSMFAMRALANYSYHSWVVGHFFCGTVLVLRQLDWR